MEYTRTPCFGPCPAYKLEVQADGQARYVGRSNVNQHRGVLRPMDACAIARSGHLAGEVQLSSKAGNYDNP